MNLSRKISWIIGEYSVFKIILLIAKYFLFLTKFNYPLISAKTARELYLAAKTTDRHDMRIEDFYFTVGVLISQFKKVLLRFSHTVWKKLLDNKSSNFLWIESNSPANYRFWSREISLVGLEPFFYIQYVTYCNVDLKSLFQSHVIIQI